MSGLSRDIANLVVIVVIGLLFGALYIIYIKFVKKNPILKRGGSPKGQELISRAEQLDDEEEDNRR
jgi:hypothetical protein